MVDRLETGEILTGFVLEHFGVFKTSFLKGGNN
jgi:hypothetical protein